MDKLLLLGASGFIGSSILKTADSAQNIKSILAFEHKTPIDIDLSNKTTIINGQIGKIDLSKTNASHIIHAARNASSHGRIGRLISALGGQHFNHKLLEKFQQLRTSNNTKIWYISGSLMYGNNLTHPATESSVLNPISYAKDYIYAETPFLKAVKENVNVHLIRVPWVFGNGSWFKRFYLDYIHKNNAVPLYGDGKNIMTLIERGDLAKAILSCFKNGDNPIMNLYMNDYCTQESFVQILQEITNLPIIQYSNQELKKEFGNAAFEAFTSSIKLSSDYNQKPIHAVMKYNSISEMLHAELPLFLNSTI